MDPVLYKAAGGGRTDFKRQEIIANNLANINTPGFKADLYQAQSMYLDSKTGSNQSYNVQAPNNVDISPGEIMHTGRDLDVAVNGDGWLAVQDSNGKEVYTRSGSLRLDTTGRLITASGHSVMGNGGPISIPPAKSIEVASDGTISVLPLDGGDAKNLAVLDRIKMVRLDKSNVVKNDEGLIQTKDGSVPAGDSKLTLTKGALEGSNVNAIEQMVAMIGAGREFDAQMKVLSDVSDNTQKLAQTLQI
jgi:flagellar basal-body rod protein FlgF